MLPGNSVQNSVRRVPGEKGPSGGGFARDLFGRAGARPMAPPRPWPVPAPAAAHGPSAGPGVQGASADRGVGQNAFMATPRRTGTESSATRAFLLDVTERVMREDGYAAVSSRTVAKSAGVTPALIHYYFPTLDDLFIALFRRGAERNLQRQEVLLASPRPLHEIWGLVTEAARTALLTEFMALGNHRKIIRDEIAEYSKRSRR